MLFGGLFRDVLDAQGILRGTLQKSFSSFTAVMSMGCFLTSVLVMTLSMGGAVLEIVLWMGVETPE